MFHLLTYRKPLSLVARWLAVALCWLGIMGIGGAVQAASPSPTIKPKATPAAVVSAGPYFFQGKRLVLDQNYQGNVFAVGNEVLVTGSIQGNLIVAGGTIHLAGPVKGMVLAAGGVVSLEGRIDGDVFVAGAEVRQNKMAVITGALAAAAKQADIAGRVQGKTWLGAQMSSLNGQVDRDLKIVGESLTVGPLATVAGQVWGQLRVSPVVQAPASWAHQPQFVVKADELNHARRWLGAPIFSMAWIVAEVFKILASVIVALVIWYCVPKLVRSAAQSLQTKPWSALGRGIAVVGVTPLVVFLVAITGVGFGLAILITALYVVLLIASSVVPASVIGGYLVPKSAAWLQIVVGIVVVGLLMAVPVVGWLVKLAIVLLGAGAWTYSWHGKE